MCCFCIDSWRWHQVNAFAVLALWLAAIGCMGTALFAFVPGQVGGEHYIMYYSFGCACLALVLFISMRARLGFCCWCCCGGTPHAAGCRRGFATQALYFMHTFTTQLCLWSTAQTWAALESASKASFLDESEAILFCAAAGAVFLVSVLNIFFGVEQFAVPVEGFCCFREPADGEYKRMQDDGAVEMERQSRLKAPTGTFALRDAKEDVQHRDKEDGAGSRAEEDRFALVEKAGLAGRLERLRLAPKGSACIATK